MKLIADRIRVGLALGGGAARALAHLGVLRVFEEEGIAVGAIAGTSMGALIGGMYALHPDAREVRARVLGVLFSKEFLRVKVEYMRALREVKEHSVFRTLVNYFRRSVFHNVVLNRQSFLPPDRYMRHIAAFVGDRLIEECLIPFAAVATDVRSGEEVVITRGPMRVAVAASCAIPGILPPVELDGLLLIDGGWVDHVPVAPVAALGADLVVGVEIGAPTEDPEGLLRNGLEMVIRANAITRAALSRLQLSRADLVIRPATDRMDWLDFRQADEAIRLGEAAARAALPALREALARRLVQGPRR
ncbi:MAG TPA: patatin-like phospholipase family protein, partial [Thermodesulfobacteriota bacterium]|nr:patatin-like phospholipase family protein [Thermodesulfobacteriota bacterium]